MKELGLWTIALKKVRRTRPKAHMKSLKTSSKRKFLLSMKELASGSGESAAVHFVESDRVSISDDTDVSDDDPAVGRTVEILSVIGCDAPILEQEKETRTVGGISSQ